MSEYEDHAKWREENHKKLQQRVIDQDEQIKHLEHELKIYREAVDHGHLKFRRELGLWGAEKLMMARDMSTIDSAIEYALLIGGVPTRKELCIKDDLEKAARVALAWFDDQCLKDLPNGCVVVITALRKALGESQPKFKIVRAGVPIEIDLSAVQFMPGDIVKGVASDEQGNPVDGVVGDDGTIHFDYNFNKEIVYRFT